jgi:hypothetical protein
VRWRCAGGAPLFTGPAPGRSTASASESGPIPLISPKMKRSHGSKWPSELHHSFITLTPSPHAPRCCTESKSKPNYLHRRALQCHRHYQRPPAGASWSICLHQWSCCVPSTSPPLFLYCDTGQPDLHYTDLHCLLDYRHTGRSCFAQSLPCLRFTRDQPTVRSIEPPSAVPCEPAPGPCCNVPGAAQLVHPFLCPLCCLLPLLGMATADMVR